MGRSSRSSSSRGSHHHRSSSPHSHSHSHSAHASQTQPHSQSSHSASGQAHPQQRQTEQPSSSAPSAASPSPAGFSVNSFFTGWLLGSVFHHQSHPPTPPHQQTQASQHGPQPQQEETNKCLFFAQTLFQEDHRGTEIRRHYQLTRSVEPKQENEQAKDMLTQHASYTGYCYRLLSAVTDTSQANEKEIHALEKEQKVMEQFQEEFFRTSTSDKNKI